MANAATTAPRETLSPLVDCEKISEAMRCTS